MFTLFKFMNTIQSDVKGATAIEYGLIAALVAVAIITGLTLLGTQLDATFTSVTGSLSSVTQ